jgi:tryptophan synthase alpha subunit
MSTLEQLYARKRDLKAQLVTILTSGEGTAVQWKQTMKQLEHVRAQITELGGRNSESPTTYL